MNSFEKRIILAGILILIVIGPIVGDITYASDFPVQDESKIYLPLVIQPETFSMRGLPIWMDDDGPHIHEVALFRKTFTLSQEIDLAEIHIFADTRYKIYLDGTLLGRGPARFSRNIHEYDIYPLEKLQPEEHIIAVLVQWSPNNRRSESVTPFLIADFWDSSGEISSIQFSTDETWKTIRSDAWQPEAELVHSWGLIGSTELLDLRKLPPNWMEAAYDDSSWMSAIPADLSTVQVPLFVESFEDPRSRSAASLLGGIFEPVIENLNPKYQPRSIDFLINRPISPTLLSAGTLSPERILLELPGDQSSYDLEFNVLSSTFFSVEKLDSTNVSQPGSFFLNQTDMTFGQAASDRPGVVIATRFLGPGTHTLSIDDIPPDGMTFSVSTDNISFQNSLPFEQGVHAGRRLLLSEPISNTLNSGENIDLDLSLKFLALPGYAVIDLGRTIHGRAELEIQGSSGTVVDLGWDERLYPDTKRPLPFPGSLHPQWNQVDSWVLDGTLRKVSTIDTRSGRYLLLAVWGEDPVDVILRVNEERYPVEQHGYFDSSNELLDCIWQVGVETAYPNMTDAYADPWRERGQWWGDAFIVDRVNRVAFGDFSLLRRGLIFMADAIDNGKPEAMAPNGSGVYMLDYAMLWLHDLQEYLQLTADSELASQLYPKLLSFMQYLHEKENPSTGLLEMPDDIWANTVYIDPLAQIARKGQSTPTNAIYYETFLQAALIAEQLGYHSQAAEWRVRAEQVRNQINTLLFRSDQQRYLTSIYQSQEISPTIYAQAWPLAYGIVPPESSVGVIQAFQEMLIPDPESTNIGIYGLYWVLEGYGRYGYFSDAIDLIENYYGWLLDNGATTWWEGFDKDSYAGARSHGWGSSPTWFLTTYILGARQTGPESWQVTPSFDGVDTVTGALPLPDGVLNIYWEKNICQTNYLDIEAPLTTSGLAIIPDSMDATILLNGEFIWHSGVALIEGIEAIDGDVNVPLGGGIHQFSIVQSCSGN